MKIEALVNDAPVGPLFGIPEMDALMEAQLLELRVDAVAGRTAMIFDLRTALQVHTGNTAVLVLERTRSVEWSAEPRATGRTAWNVVSSTPATSGRSFSLRLEFVPDASFEVVAEAASFYVGTVAALADAPQDYVSDSEATIRAGLPGWDSTIESIQATSIGL
jgi:hypothetical protein